MPAVDGERSTGHRCGITSRLLERLPTIETPPGYDDLRAIEPWAGPIANCDWHQESEEWRMMLYRMADLLTDVVVCPERHLILVGDDLHCCPRGWPYPALLVRPDPEDYWVDVRQIRVLLLAGHHLISLEVTGGLRKEVWRSDAPDGDGSITDALARLEGLPPSIEITPHGNLSLRGDDLELSYPAFWERCTRPLIQPMMP